MIIDNDPATSPKGKAKDVIQQVPNTSAGSSVLTPISTEPPKQRIILNRSQRFRIYAPVSVFQAPNFAQVKSALQTVFQNLPSLTDIYERKIKKDKDTFVHFVIVEFFMKKDGEAALALTIPGTDSKFQIINDRQQLADLVNASAKSQDSPDSASGSSTAPTPVPKIHNDFADRKAIRYEQDKRTVKVLDIPLNFTSADVTAALSHYGTVQSCRLHTKNSWQQPFVCFESEDSALKFYDEWGIIYLKHFLKVHPLNLPTEEWQKRSRFVLKLTELPSGTTIVDLLDIFDATNAKTIVIPKGIRAYQPRPYAYVSFESEAVMEIGPV